MLLITRDYIQSTLFGDIGEKFDANGNAGSIRYITSVIRESYLNQTIDRKMYEKFRQGYFCETTPFVDKWWSEMVPIDICNKIKDVERNMTNYITIWSTMGKKKVAKLYENYTIKN